ncbi:MAG: molybdopterin-dependent oxidoreductase, partial [Bryobacteraceae bacterium]
MLRLSETENRTALQICATHCPYCSLQCGMHLRSRDMDSWSVIERDFPTNRGGLCQKGWTAAELLRSPDRLRSPLVRDTRAESFRPASWDEALDRVTAAVEGAQRKYGKDAVGV